MKGIFKRPPECKFDEENVSVTMRYPPGEYTITMKDDTGNGLSFIVKVAGVVVLEDEVPPSYEHLPTERKSAFTITL